MSNITVQNQQSNQLPIERLFEDASITTQIGKLLGAKSTQFVTSIVQLVSSSDALKNCDPTSVYQCAVMAALLDFPINNNLGYAYIIPYGNKAQFQMSYKGYIQLAIRSGKYQTLGASPIYDGQLVSENPLTGYVFDFSKKKSDKVVGYAAQFVLLEGFSKTWYMTVEEVEKHAQKYSKTYSHANGRWKIDFDAMALKTVIKLLLSKYGVLSVEMKKAIEADQAVINDAENGSFIYADNEPKQLEANNEEEIQRWTEAVNECLNNDALTKLFNDSKAEIGDSKAIKAVFTKRKIELENNK